MKQTYIVELRSAPIEDLDTDILECFSDEVFDDQRLLGPAPSADLALHVIELRAAIDAGSPGAALDVALASFSRAAKKSRLHGIDVVDLSVWLDDDSEYDRRELLSGADIAERLGISRQRIAQLVAEKGRFPRPAATFGTISVWQWGDVADWIAAGGRGDVNRLAAEAVVQVFSLARDDEQRISAVLRLIDLANEGNGSAGSFLEHLNRNVVAREDESGMWFPGALLRKYDKAKKAEKPDTVIDLMAALRRSIERERARERPTTTRSGKKTA